MNRIGSPLFVLVGKFKFLKNQNKKYLIKSTGKKNGGCKEPSIEQNEEENGNDSNIINTA